ncbi:CBU_0592 family membrane protein [Hyphomonas sp. NPDC076900]|uniref:CBU_0592 family membrane protein n=1 Tax=unclassified Hyphomonas TaxID=2630699 RepID=UPI003D03CB73
MTITELLIEAAGWTGAALILGAYILLSLGRLQGNSPAYQWANVIGAAGFILNSGYHGAIPSVAINILWVAIGVFALWRIYKVAA